MIDSSRLLSQLLISGLQTDNQPLYQLIRDLIKNQALLEALIGSGSGSGSGGGGGIVNVTNVIQQIISSDGDSGGDAISIPGAAGEDGVNGMVPYFIATGEVFTVPEFKQALFSINIDNEGILEVDGFLIEVD